jgi:hypothetical protein
MQFPEVRVGGLILRSYFGGGVSTKSEAARGADVIEAEREIEEKKDVWIHDLNTRFTCRVRHGRLDQ